MREKLACSHSVKAVFTRVHEKHAQPMNCQSGTMFYSMVFSWGSTYENAMK